MKTIKFKRLFTPTKHYDYKHSVCVVLLFLSVLCTAVFFKVSVFRTIESIRDLGLSIGYYFCEMFTIPHSISPTVLSVPDLGKDYYTLFPFTFGEFQNKLYDLGKLIINLDNIQSYFLGLGGIASGVLLFLIICLPFILLAVIVVRRALNGQNNDYNEDTKPLKVFKTLSKHSYIPIKNALKSFINFLKQNSFYIKIIIALWLFNLNLITIVIELLAFLFYFVASLDFLHIYTQVYKLFLDLSVAIRTIPIWLYIVIALYIMNRFRKNIGYSRLRHFEMYNRGFINSLPIVSMVVGTMGKKKTTMLTDMALSLEVMLRDKAFEMLLENDLKFPYFTWINLENELRRAVAYHQVYNLATVKFWAYKKAYRWSKNKCNQKCFDYDYNRYGLTYDDSLKVVDVWDVVSIYAQLYFIYTIQSSLLIANYSIRTDNLIMDLGNFPLWNTDFFKRDSKLIDSYSRHSHIIDMDMLRLGRKVLENNYKSNALEFGVIVMTEAGKERGNGLDAKEMKKSAYETNQKNDLFNTWLKMARHSATVDNFPFIKVIMDEQRPMSLGADARELCSIIHIRDSSDFTLAMPFYFIETLVHDFIYLKFKGFYTNYRFNRADNTLLLHLIKSVSGKVYNYNKRIHNTFDFCELALQTEKGVMDGAFDERKYYLSTKKIYSKRFSTDCFSEYFAEKAMLSPIGLNDLIEYATERATFEELKSQNSYFINDLLNTKQHI